jgi:hypothetical protein
VKTEKITDADGKRFQPPEGYTEIQALPDQRALRMSRSLGRNLVVATDALLDRSSSARARLGFS